MAYYSYKRVRDILIELGEIIYDEDDNLTPKNKDLYGADIDNTYLGNLYEMIADEFEKLQAENAELTKRDVGANQCLKVWSDKYVKLQAENAELKKLTVKALGEVGLELEEDTRIGKKVMPFVRAIVLSKIQEFK